MGAYTKVDNGTRRKMDEMLKTWKEPVPGSISTKSVFPPEHVRPIEHALVAFRQAAYAANQNSFQGQQQLLRGNRAPIPPRDTPTPPNTRPLSQPAGPHSQQPFPGSNGHPPQHMDQTMAQQQPYPMRPHHVRLPFSLIRRIYLLTILAGPQLDTASCPATSSSHGHAYAHGHGPTLSPRSCRSEHRQAER